VTVDELSGRAVKVQGDPSHPVTRGFLCGKVAKYLDRVYSPDRLLYPMRRKAGVAKGPLAQGREAEAFERISWDEALDEIAARADRSKGAVYTHFKSKEDLFLALFEDRTRSIIDRFLTARLSCLSMKW